MRGAKWPRFFPFAYLRFKNCPPSSDVDKRVTGGKCPLVCQNLKNPNHNGCPYVFGKKHPFGEVTLLADPSPYATPLD